MRTKKRISPSLVEVDFDELLTGDPEFRALYEQALVTAQVARLVYDGRHAAGWTQRQLAERVGTTQSVIARLEDDNYEGQSLRMLRRIAEALRQGVEIRFVPRPGTAQKGSRKNGQADGLVQQALLENGNSNERIARLVRGARTGKGLTQKQLARLARTTQPVIARLEDADYRGHSLRMLVRIAAALQKDVKLRLVPSTA